MAKNTEGEREREEMLLKKTKSLNLFECNDSVPEPYYLSSMN